MEQAPRITSVYEKENELRKRERLRRIAEQKRLETRKKAVTAFAIMRMLMRLAITPKRELRQRVIRQGVQVARVGRRIATGDRDRMSTIGRLLTAR